MYKVVIDLEMADRYSDEFKHNKEIKFMQEIIEIGAVILDHDNQIVGYYSCYVKPRYSILSNAIKSLTGITEDKIETGKDIEDALKEFVDVIQNHCSINDAQIITWSDTDVKTIKKELEIKQLDLQDVETLCKNKLDLQKEFSKRTKFGKQVNLEKAFDLVGIKFDGKAHDALIDAINTSKLYIEMSDDTEVAKVINKINEIMTPTDIGTSLGSMFDFSKFKLEE